MNENGRRFAVGEGHIELKVFLFFYEIFLADHPKWSMCTFKKQKKKKKKEIRKERTNK